MSEVVLGVSGGIASYKAAELLRLFTESGYSVRVVPTEASLHFVGTATWEALSGKPAQSAVFEQVDQVAHVRIGQGADPQQPAERTHDGGVLRRNSPAGRRACHRQYFGEGGARLGR